MILFFSNLIFKKKENMMLLSHKYHILSAKNS